MRCKSTVSNGRRCSLDAMLFGFCIMHQPKSNKEQIKITKIKKVKPMEEIEKWN
jgi:hypothetical protein